MKIVYAFPEASNPDQYAYNNIRSTLLERGHSIVDFDYVSMKERFGTEGMVAELRDLVDRERPDIFWHGIVDDELPTGILDELRDRDDLMSIVFFSDDDWRIHNHSLQWAGHYNFGSTNDINAPAIYRQSGFRHLCHVQYAANPQTYFPRTVEKKYDVTFVGQAYLGRPQIVRELLSRGIDVRVWGAGWNQFPEFAGICGPPLSTEDMITTFCASRIVLGFAWCSVPSVTGGVIPQIKGRTFEYPACGAFQITYEDDRLYNYFERNREVATFRNAADLADKVRYYLGHEKEREEMAGAAHERVLREHTWRTRWDTFFPFLTEENMHRGPRKIWAAGTGYGAGVTDDGNDPLVSVYCFVYNREKYIAQTMESVLNQTYRNLEFVILNDGSTDGTADIVERYLGDERIRYHYQDNIGRTLLKYDELNNRAVKLTKGEFVGCIGADDVYLPDKIARQVAEFKLHPELDVSFCNGRLIDDSGNLLSSQFRHARALTFNRNNFLRWIFTSNFIAHPSVLIRRSAFDAHGGFVTGYCPDLQFWLKTAGKLQYKYLDEMLWYYRVHDESGTAPKNNELMMRSTFEVLKAFHDSCAIEDLYPEIDACGNRTDALYSAHLDLGNLLLTGRFALLPHLAVAEYARARATGKDAPEAANNLAVAFAATGNRENAGKTFDTLREVSRENGIIAHNIEVFRRSSPEDPRLADYRILTEDAGSSELQRMILHLERRGDLLPGSTLTVSRGVPRGLPGDKDHGKEAPMPPRPVSPGLTTVVIPVTHIGDNLRRCLESIDASLEDPYEMILSTEEGSALSAWIKKTFPENLSCVVVEHDKGSGFAAACNEALRKARGEHILLIDSGAVLSAEAVTSLFRCIGRDTDHGLAVPLSNSASGIQQIPGTRGLSYEEFERHTTLSRKRNRGSWMETWEIDTPCVLIRGETLDTVGLFDESMAVPFSVINDYRLRALINDYIAVIALDACVYSATDRTGRPGSDRVFRDKWDRFDPATDRGKKLSPCVAIQNARGHYRKGDPDKAIEALMDGIRHTPLKRSIYYCLADILMEEKRYQDAIDTVRGIPQGPGSRVRSLTILGHSFFSLGHTEEAENYAAALSELPGGRAASLYLLGLICLRKGQRPEAEDHFRKAIEIDGNLAGPRLHLGVLRWQDGDQAAAFDLIEEGFARSPETEDFSATYRSAAGSLGQLSRAGQVLLEVLQLHPGDRKLTFLHIGILLENGKYAEAMTEIEKAIVAFGASDEMLAAALAVRKKLGPLTIARNGKGSPTLSVCMIVKNEEEHIARCLASLTPVADEIIVVDTGSTDRTVDIARVFGAGIFDLPWTDDFSAARNFSLEKAGGDWILVHDADEVLSPLDHGRLRTMIDAKPPQPVAFQLITRNYITEPATDGWTPNDGFYNEEEGGNGWFPSAKVRLFTKDRRLCFVNPVHEVLEPSIIAASIDMRTCDIPIHHYGKLPTDRNRRKADVYYLLGRKKLEEMGNVPGALRELAVQAAEMGKYEEAITHWQEFVKLVPGDALPFFNMATIYMEMGRHQEALRAAARARKIDPASKETALTFATASICNANPGEAIAVLEELLHRTPVYPPAEVCLAAAYCTAGKKKDGTALLKELLKKGYNYYPALNALSRKLISSQRGTLALLLLEPMHEILPSDGNTAALVDECTQSLSRAASGNHAPGPPPG